MDNLFEMAGDIALLHMKGIKTGERSGYLRGLHAARRIIEAWETLGIEKIKEEIQREIRR